MSKFYAVTLSTTAIVEVPDDASPFDAAEVARSEQREICGDVSDMDVEVHGEVRSTADLIEHGWDGMCIPYGGDGNTRLESLLAIPNTGKRSTSAELASGHGIPDSTAARKGDGRCEVANGGDAQTASAGRAHPSDACPECDGAGEFESALHCETCFRCNGTGKNLGVDHAPVDGMKEQSA